jgi:gamma-glutamylcyclotransferase (GGCT)/AIG2-like uncharacterized protein YtfP
VKHKVFVYGTLRPHATPGGWTHSLMGYMMYDYGRFPFITKELSGVVRGEIIEVTDKQLKELDKYENTASGLYTRETVSVLTRRELGFGDVDDVFVYVGNEKQLIPQRVTSGNWYSPSR